MGHSLGCRRRVGMRVVVSAAPAPAHAMACPAFDAGPADGDKKHDDGKRNSDASNVEDVAERVVRRCLIERSGLLDNGDEHHTSGGAPERTCWGERLESISLDLVMWLTRCDVI